MSKERQTAEQILLHIGGQENILNVEHCATRLRLVLKDETKFNKKEIEAIDGVKGSFLASGQHQIILGTGFVNKVFAEVIDITKMDNGKMIPKSEAAAVHMNVFQKASRLLGDVFLPIIPILVATGLFMGLRSLITNLGVELDPTFLALSQVLIDTAFAFLPALVTYSVMKRSGASPALGIVIGLMLVAPQLPNANQVASGKIDPIYLSLLGLNIPILGYQGSVLPALMLGVISAKIEKWLRKVVPDVLDLIITPFVTLFSSMVIGLVVIGPIMHIVEKGLVEAISFLMNIPLGIGGFVVGALQQAVVITGLHHTFKALEVELLANTGSNPFNALVCGAIVAQGAAGIAAALKTRNKKQKSLYLTSVLPAFLGITEPLIFGGNLPRLTPFICGCIGGGFAGMFSSFVGLAGTGMSITALPGILLYLNGQLGKYLIACAIGFVVAFVLTYIFYKTEE
ncbi:PTS transporter subunit EIIC [Lacrimispora celerecrescens]|uniref:PTS system sucrose-specific IIC component n=1 Tax=[Clostridium] celerecrescens 18A TaxID=1286362 RepID=A0A2M8ZAW0_9FIRM|nr:PTS transporter subunit EIIC [Lacrimispora celerecrescens]PJJ30584.1 PTS system sucrose-specific IIC component [[Clostridium] celerecrescens 18A]